MVVPVLVTWPKSPLAGVPPICKLSVPAAVCAKLPATLSVLPAPTVKLPLLLKSPVVEKLAPPVTLKPPLLEAMPAMAVIVAPLPPRPMLPALSVIAVLAGNASVAPCFGAPGTGRERRARNLGDGRTQA